VPSIVLAEFLTFRKGKRELMGWPVPDFLMERKGHTGRRRLVHGAGQVPIAIPTYGGRRISASNFPSRNASPIKMSAMPMRCSAFSVS
jgi:hypothetical protein